MKLMIQGHPRKSGSRLPQALQIQKEMEKAVWLSQEFTLRNSHVSSEAAARWEVKLEKFTMLRFVKLTP